MATPTNTPSLDDLKQAALTAEQAPQVPAVVPAAPEPNTPFKDADGSWKIKLATGEEYKAANEQELIRTLAGEKVKTAEWAKNVKTEADRIQAEMTARQTPVSQSPPEDVEAVKAREFLLNETARALGFSDGNELKTSLGRINESSEQQYLESVSSQFHQKHPEFPATEEATQKLTQLMFQNGLLRQLPNGDADPRDLTLDKLSLAHAAAVQYGLYKPLTQEEIRASMQFTPQPGIQSARPAPMIAPQSNQQVAENFNPYDPKVSLEQVKQWAMNANKR